MYSCMQQGIDLQTGANLPDIGAGFEMEVDVEEWMMEEGVSGGGYWGYRKLLFLSIKF